MFERPSPLRALVAASCVALLALGGACGPKAEDLETDGSKADEGAADGSAPAKPEAPAKVDSTLGALASTECRDAMKALGGLEALRTKGGRPDAKAAQAHWQTLEPWVKAMDRNLGRVPARTQGRDVALAGQHAAQMGAAERDEDVQRALVGLTSQIRLVAFLEARRLLTVASDAKPDEAREPELLASQWDTAWCLWQGAVQPLARRVDASPTRGGEDWEATITAAFTEGRAAIDGSTHDPAITMARRQVIEKGSYALIHRLILDRAAAGEDPTGPFEAGSLLDLLEDRIEDRNGPGLARMRKAVYGPVRDLEVAELERDLAVAFVKRARKYCDEAVTGGSLGTPEAIKGAWEGRIYSQVVITTMGPALSDAGFDADAYLADWDDYIEAVTAADSEAAAAISARLVKWNCDYQDRLEIAACTSSANETE